MPAVSASEPNQGDPPADVIPVDVPKPEPGGTGSFPPAGSSSARDGANPASARESESESPLAVSPLLVGTLPQAPVPEAVRSPSPKAPATPDLAERPSPRRDKADTGWDLRLGVSPDPEGEARSGSVAESRRIREDTFLRRFGVVLGLVLLGSIFSPVGPDGSFVWDVLRSRPISDIDVMRWFFPAGLGLLVAVLGFVRLPAVARAGIYAGLGLVPIVYFVVRAAVLVTDPAPFESLGLTGPEAASAASDLQWRLSLLSGTLILLSGGLLLRVRTERLAAVRIVLGIAIAATLCAFLFPLPSLRGASALPVVALFEGLGVQHKMGTVLAVAILMPALFALVALVAFPSRRWRGIRWVAWATLAWLPVVALVFAIYAIVTGADSPQPIEAVRLLVYGFTCHVFAVVGLTSLTPAELPTPRSPERSRKGTPPREEETAWS